MVSSTTSKKAEQRRGEPKRADEWHQKVNLKSQIILEVATIEKSTKYEDVQISATAKPRAAAQVVDLCLAPFITFAWSQNATAAETETLLSVLCTQPENMQSRAPTHNTADWFSLSVVVDLLFDQPCILMTSSSI